MSIASPPLPPIPSGSPPESLWPLSVDQYHEMIRTGIVADDDPVELLDGILVRKTPKYPLHRYMTELMRERLVDLLPSGYFTDSQGPVTLAGSEPEPDITVIRGERLDFADRHPEPADVALLIEISDSSLSRDRGWKKRVYAKARIPIYWIINLVDRQIEVFTDPDETAGDYRQPAVFKSNEAVPLVIDGKTIATLRLDELLPPA